MYKFLKSSLDILCITIGFLGLLFCISSAVSLGWYYSQSLILLRSDVKIIERFSEIIKEQDINQKLKGIKE